MEKTTLFIADDHPAILAGIKMAFDEEPEFEILGTASDGVKTVQKVKKQNPDLVIMDISMPRMNGMDVANEIRTWKKDIPIVVYTMHSDRVFF